MILEITAKINEGLCGGCAAIKKQKEEERFFEESVTCPSCKKETCTQTVKGMSLSLNCSNCNYSVASTYQEE